MELSVFRADNYIEKHRTNKNPEIMLRVRFIEYLKEVLLYKGPDVHVYGADIISNISYGLREKVTDYYLKSNIVANLRDNDVLIASNRKGYKLPTSKKDIIDFFEMFFSNIDPMIKRIRNCYKSIILATGNDIDLLEDNKFYYLNKIIIDNDEQ